MQIDASRYDTHLMNIELRQVEHETAQLLYDRLLSEGFEPRKAISLVYRAGRIDAKKSLRRHKNELNKRVKTATAALLAAGIQIPDYQQRE